MSNNQQAQVEKKRNYKSYGESNKETNALIEKKFPKYVKSKKRRMKEKEESQISDYKSKKIISSMTESIESGEILSSSSK